MRMHIHRPSVPFWSNRILGDVQAKRPATRKGPWQGRAESESPHEYVDVADWPAVTPTAFSEPAGPAGAATPGVAVSKDSAGAHPQLFRDRTFGRRRSLVLGRKQRFCGFTPAAI